MFIARFGVVCKSQSMHDGTCPLDLHERFALIARIGAGAHGEVFEAVDRLRDTRVALKALRHATPQSILRFKREFRELQSVQHPNLVSLGELFEQGGQWFFSMELVAGEDFLEHVRHGAQQDDHSGTLTLDADGALGFDEVRLRRALLQLGRGLEALHSAGKAHRDVKPSNIRVRPDGHLVLLDFGLVASYGGEQASNAERLVGTVAYMAPEQARGAALSPAVDSYALGILLYEALTGGLPFSGSPIEVLQAKQTRAVSVPPCAAALLPANLVELCHDLCQLDPLRRPTASELVARVGGTRTVVNARAPAAVSVCLGRERELNALEQAFAQASAGELCKVSIQAPAGLGKTTLLAAFRAQLTERAPDACVLSGSCQAPEFIAYKAFDAAIDELGRKLERLSHEQCAGLVPRHVACLVRQFPVLGRLLSVAGGEPAATPLDPITQRLRAGAALRELLQRLAARGPVVLILDDLQWSDEDSLELLSALTRVPEPPPLLLVAATRCDEENPAGFERVFGADTLHIAVPALPVGAAVELAGRLMHPRHALTPVQLAAAAEYHPLLIERLARARCAGRDLNETLWLELQARSGPARKVLLLLALSGSTLPERVLGDASQLSPMLLTAALAELRREKLVCVYESAGELVVTSSHAQFRGVLRARLQPHALQQLHLALAQALARADTNDPEALALHWQGAAEHAAAARCFVQAAERAERMRAYGQAAALYRNALSAAALSGAHDIAQRSAWHERMGTALAFAGRSADAAEAYLAAAQGQARERTRTLSCLAAQHFLRAGNSERGLTIARPLLAEIGEHLPDEHPVSLLGLAWNRFRLTRRHTLLQEPVVPVVSERERYACDLLWSVGVPLGSQNVFHGIHVHSRGLARALRLQDPARLARSLALEALYMEPGTAEAELRVRGLLATAEELAARCNEPYLLAFVSLCRATFRLLSGEPALALCEADAAALRFEDECQNVAWELGFARATALSSLSYLGRFRELESRYACAVEDAEARGNVHNFATLVTLNRCTIDLVNDRVALCHEHMQRAMRDVPEDWHMQRAFAFGTHVLLDLYMGGDSAHRRIEGAWRSLQRELLLRSLRFRVFFLYARGLAALSALVADGHEPRARRKIVQQCARQLAREGSLDAQAGARMLQAQLATYAGERSAAIAHYRVAAELWERVGMYGSHIAKLRLGEALGGEEGARLVAECESWAREQGVVRPGRFFRVCGPVSWGWRGSAANSGSV
jgi:eukaryotic-like serine/threonine-protein kinase